MTTFLWKGAVFGPIHSRRLGSSLGINLLPTTGKVCNFDCIYCECGWNRDGRTTEKIPESDEIINELNSKLSILKKEGIPIDTITFSGNGEPTLHPDFPDIIDHTLILRDRYYPESKISVLSNSTTAHCDAIRNALMKTDNPIMKLDGGDDMLIRDLNNPPKGYSRENVISALKLFNGNFILQTMFLKGTINGHKVNSADLDNVDKWIKTVLELRPREVMMYTIDRDTPSDSLEKVEVRDMESIAENLRNHGITVQVRG